MKTVEREVNKFNFPQILLDLHRENKTGILTVDTDEVIKKVYLDKGKAVFASSTDEDDRLGETLIKLGKITIEQYEKSVELLKQTGKRQGTILVELGYLTPKDLVLGVKAQVREIIYGLFQVEYAAYEFSEGPLPTREVITLQMSMGNLIYEGMKRINNVVRIKRDMPDMDAALKMNDDPASLFQDIVLSPRDKAMIEMIDGTKTIREIIDSTPAATFEALKTLYILHVSGFVAEQMTPEKGPEPEADAGNTEESVTSNDAFERQVNELFSNLYKMKPHEILGVVETSDAKILQDNYYKLIKEYHPDQHISSADPLMLDKLITISDEIQKAYALLKEDDARGDYFRSLSDIPQESNDEEDSEEHFRAELAKVNEEMFAPNFTDAELDVRENENGNSAHGLRSDKLEDFKDFPPEENSEEFFPAMDDASPTSDLKRDASITAFLEEEAIMEKEETEEAISRRSKEWASRDTMEESRDIVDFEEADETKESPSQESSATEGVSNETEDEQVYDGIPVADLISKPDILSGEESAPAPAKVNDPGSDLPDGGSAAEVKAGGDPLLQESVHQELLNLVGDIKILLREIRAELARVKAANRTVTEEPGVGRDMKECLEETSAERFVLEDSGTDDQQTTWQEEFITVPETAEKYISEQAQEMPVEEQKDEPKEPPTKKKLNLWYIGIPGLFLIAAVATFLLLYSPAQKGVISQPIKQSQAKQESIPQTKPASIVKETPPSAQQSEQSSAVPAPEVKTVPVVAAPPEVPHSLELIASDATWLSATIDGKTPKEMMLRAGDKVQWTAKNSVSLVIGNAAGLRLVFDGKELGPLGGKGKVVKLRLPASPDH